MCQQITIQIYTNNCNFFSNFVFKFLQPSFKGCKTTRLTALRYCESNIFGYRHVARRTNCRLQLPRLPIRRHSRQASEEQRTHRDRGAQHRHRHGSRLPAAMPRLQRAAHRRIADNASSPRPSRGIGRHQAVLLHTTAGHTRLCLRLYLQRHQARLRVLFCRPEISRRARHRAQRIGVLQAV